jgi:membrane-bound lytic murein transglycosylase MltF
MQTTPYTYRLLQLIEETSGKCGEDYLQTLAAELPDTLDRQNLLGFALNTLQDMASKGILIPAVAV